MFAIIGTLCFLVVIIMTILLICGFPLDEFTLGGQFTDMSLKLRLFIFLPMMLVQIFGAIILLQNAGFIPLFFHRKL